LASATAFNFDVTFNGTTASVDLGSDPVAGTSLVPGDSFFLDIHTANDDFWEVTGPTNLGIYASFFVQDSGTRTGNVVTTFLLNGIQVAQDVDLALQQQFVHMGAQVFNLPMGLQFDQVQVSYSFLSTTSTFTTIQPSADSVNLSPFFPHSSVSYVQNSTEVPDPATTSPVVTAFAISRLRAYRRRKSSN